MYPQVVTVWEYSRKQLSIKQCLYGHTDAVTCLAVSPLYNVIVSGSRDATAIVWDLSRRIFVRQLQGHAAPVAAVAINELTVSTIILQHPVSDHLSPDITAAPSAPSAPSYMQHCLKIIS
jgi:WD40 repeat protein